VIKNGIIKINKSMRKKERMIEDPANNQLHGNRKGN